MRTGAFLIALAAASAYPDEGRAEPPQAGEVAGGDTSTVGDAQDLERLGANLAYHTGDRRVLRTVLGWSVVGAGLLVDGAPLFLGRAYADAGLFLIFASNISLPLGFSLLPSGRLDDVRAYYEQDRASGRPAAWVIDDVEAAWRHEAYAERTLRNFAGWTELVGGVIALGLDAFLVVSNTGRTATNLQPLEAGVAVMGATNVGLGIHWLASDGPVESSLREYERTTGRYAGTDARIDFLPHVALAPGGAVVGLRARF